ncbi:HD domain-containing protein [Natronomonas salsuginis]|uniref:HD domain-containing protein n=1 Tax=Natronomonas salsuginis TaxID=2217661 RepID=A0A4U5JJC2_9EURY|nr:HD domain-containing protein [Natronomonas salsuginis]TKR27827.1 HD domain-containing protein [Natronomonas salsuginis]
MSDGTDSKNGRHYDPKAEHCFPDGPLNDVLELIRADEEINAYLEAQNVNPVARMGYNDHGAKHIEIVRNAALRLYDLLKAGNVAFNGALGQGLEEADESVIIALAATLHDIGHVVHREDHSYYSIPLAVDILDRILDELNRYDVADRVKLKGEVLHAILCHHAEETPLTQEAGVVRVADALDMERGRSRIPYEKGGRGINTLSSQAIRRVSLQPGDETPVLVEIEMTDAAGVYQVDELLQHKLLDSRIEEYVRIVAINTHSGGDLVERIEM